MTLKVDDAGGGTKAMVHCKKCSKDFTRLDWMTNKVCDNPDCNCPEVKKAMQAAEAAINKAKQTSRTFIKITTTTMPTQRDETKDQMYIQVPPVTVIDVTLPKKL